MSAACRNCNDEAWVCENHQDTPWETSGHSDNCGAGAPCPVCRREMACSPYVWEVAKLVTTLRAVREWFMGYAANFGTDVAEEIALIDRALASAGEAGTAATVKQGAVHEHATAESGDAQTPVPSSRERK